MRERSPRVASAAGLALAIAVAAVRAQEPASRELVFLVQYIGSDYGVAVHDRQVVNGDEYAEMLALSARALDLYRGLSSRAPIRSDLEQLRQRILDLAPWEEVRSSCRALVPRIEDELEVADHPSEPPNLARGRLLYTEDCAPCHGISGGGDGWASPWMVPAPTSFRSPQTSLLSPHQMFNAAVLGVPGTAMPAYEGARTVADLWDVAFFLQTLREGFDPRPPPQVIPLSLKDLASHSNEELLEQFRTSRPGAGLSEVDFYRNQGPRPASMAADPDLEEAERLERVFSRVAEGVFPGVVGVSVYQRQAAPGPSQPSAGWSEGDAEANVYPGYRRVRAASGFLVSEDGDVLTSAAVLSPGGPTGKPDLLDVELAGNVHCRARVIGVEPTIDLAVLEIDAPIPVAPLPLGDSDRVRVGQWAIAVGDPPGAERIFAPGTIAARPERDCYQEHRTSTLLQSSASMAAQGFGGPLVNIRGEVIGVTVPGPAAVNALPVNLVKTIYQALKIKESSRSPWIGVSVLDLSAVIRRRLASSPLTGVYIDDVFEPSPASRAGIRAGDVLTEIDGNRLLAVADFQRWLYLLGIDATVKLAIFREGKTLIRELRIEQRPASATMR